MSDPTPHLTLIDGSSMIQRAWAVAGKEQGPNGEEVGAVRVFSRMTMKILRRMGQGSFPPTAIAVLFDPPRHGTWRRALSPEYKAHRPDQDPALTSQIALSRLMCDALGIAQGVCDTHEADDMIAAYALDAHAAGMKVSIVSADKDLMQLVRRGIMQFSPTAGKDGTWYNSAKVEEKFGVGPELVADHLALTGDSGDGVKGAPGIGPKSATALLREFGSLDEVILRAQHITRPAWRKSVEENAEALRLARRLVSLDPEGCARPFTLEQARMPHIRDVSERLEAWGREALGDSDAGPYGP